MRTVLSPPVLREFHGTILGIGGLEMFIALKNYGVPVDLIIYPDEPHILAQPIHRYYSMQRNLDWFNFWLQDKEDPDPAKAEQYVRWRELRKLKEKREPTRTAAKQ